MKRTLGAASCLLLLVALGGCGDSGSGGSVCSRYVNLLRSCGLLSEGERRCDEPTTATHRCQAQCALNATCEQHTNNLCGGGDEPLRACGQACVVMFVCGDGAEIPESWRCDGDLDCADGSDEAGCPPPQLFTCADGEQIPASWQCDGDLDCADGSDEAGCPPAQLFTCTNGDQIRASWRCDGDLDCADGSDEVDCPPRAELTCPE